MDVLMPRWFATFAPGFGPLVARLVARDVPGARIIAFEDNAIRFESEREPRAVSAYCRSLFRILGERPTKGPPRPVAPAAALEAAALAFAADRGVFGGPARQPGGPARQPGGPARQPGGPARQGAARPSARDRFVLRAFGPEDPESVPQAARRRLEAAIEAYFGGRPDPRGGPGAREFRLQARADGSVLFLERAGGSSSREAEPRRGELPRTTCRLLAEMTDPLPGDVFLDPFCGYGGIALERALAAPYRFAFAQDLDPEKVAAVKDALRDRAFERRRKTFFPKVRDALDPAAFDPGFVGAIATDPPWGVYEGGPGSDRAGDILTAFVRRCGQAMGPGGRLVLLVSRDLAGPALEAARGAFDLRESFDVLVSGRKASALRLDRKG